MTQGRKISISFGLLLGMVIFFCIYAVVSLGSWILSPRTGEWSTEQTLESQSSDIQNVDSTENAVQEELIPTIHNIEQLTSFQDVRKYLYSIDETAYPDEKFFDIDKLLNIDVRTEFSNEPKILIFHTHSQETFIDSREDKVEDTIVGIGTVLADILSNEYGVGVIHDLYQYDIVDGKTERGNSYERMEPSVRKILEQFPTIEVVIDLHRDAVPEDRRLVTQINGDDTAQIMFFNGICCENDNGTSRDVGLSNPFLDENMALSLKAHLMANELYPGFTRKIYIKPYRYSLHMKPKSLLIEAGANTNTVQEVKNAMKPLAEILLKTLTS